MQATAIIHLLERAWSHLRLAVETPERFATWDLVIVTAASPEQAELYRGQLDETRRRGLLAPDTRTLVVPDPDGRRVGSGGATLLALREAAAVCGPLDDRRVLLVHAGGDAKRLPWANPLGKPFIPLPLLADPDSACPTLFDHLLALAAPVAERLASGGMLVLTGDVLPCFAAEELPDTVESLVVTTPVPVDVAARHGVIVPGKAPDAVADLLQKPDLAALQAADALIDGGSALLDTGIFLFGGAAWRAWVAAAGDRDWATALLAADDELSLYEECAGALVPARHAWLAERPLGPDLIALLGDHPLRHCCSRALAFLHFGSSSEVLGWLNRPWSGGLTRRLLARGGDHIADSALVLESRCAAATTIGQDALVVGSRLGAGCRIGHRSVVLDCDIGDGEFRLPAHTALWQVPLRDGRRVLCCCGIDDDPKAAGTSAVWLGRPLGDWLAERGLELDDLGGDGSLWQAALFVPDEPARALEWGSWLLHGDGGAALRDRWRRAERLSLADLHRRIDYPRLRRRRRGLVAELALQALREDVAGPLDRHDRRLAALVGDADHLRDLSDGLRHPTAGGPQVPVSRWHQARADLAAAAGDGELARREELAAFLAVGQETAERVAMPDLPPADLQPGVRERIALPVRIDLAGGWSDTPPWSLEQIGQVLNLAVTLEGAAPVEAEVWTTPGSGAIHCHDDRGGAETIDDPVNDPTPCTFEHPFALAKAALRVTGLLGQRPLGAVDCHLRTRSDVPRGSGLGTSSILAAALVQALLRATGRPADRGLVSHLVLALEQEMGTGGGWQDQVGGLYPGVKFARSIPGRPLRLTVDQVPLLPAVTSGLQQRLVLAFTGQERLARNILQIIVGRYLQRDPLVVRCIRRLVDLAATGREALAQGRLDDLGAVIAEAWSVHQRMDPHCSNPALDRLFTAIDPLVCGAKLTGAGGGGFLVAVARDAEAVPQIQATLRAAGATPAGWGLA